MKLEEFLNKLEDLSWREGWMEFRAKCPAHNEDKYGRSLLIRVSAPNRRIYVHCCAGCPRAQVLEAMGMSPDDELLVKE